MPIFNEELFGPVAAICKVESFLDAIALPSRFEFGLGANVFTTELSEAMQAVEEIEAGIVWVNNRLTDKDVVPFGAGKTRALAARSVVAGLTHFDSQKWQSSTLILICRIGGTPIPLTFSTPTRE